MISLEERVILERRLRSPSMITSMFLDNSRARKIEGLTDEYVNLKELSLINIGLITLEGLPVLKSLEILDLSDNKISNSLEIISKNCPNLINLNISSNKISEFKELIPLSDLKKLKTLEIYNNSFQQDEEILRVKIFDLIPSLINLDGYDRYSSNTSDSDIDDSNDSFSTDSDNDGNIESNAESDEADAIYSSPVRSKTGKYRAKLKCEINENDVSESETDNLSTISCDDNPVYSLFDDNVELDDVQENSNYDESYGETIDNLLNISHANNPDNSPLQTTESTSSSSTTRKRAHSNDHNFLSKIYIRDSHHFF